MHPVPLANWLHTDNVTLRGDSCDLVLHFFKVGVIHNGQIFTESNETQATESEISRLAGPRMGEATFFSFKKILQNFAITKKMSWGLGDK